MEGEEEPTFSSSEERMRHYMNLEKMAQGWIMMATPFPMLMILLLYGLILMIGPRLMRNREPFEVKTAMRLYNAFQIVHNLYIFNSIIENTVAIPYLLRKACSVVSYEDDAVSELFEKFLYYSWHYLVNKHLDLIDTVFMVLRKKNSHITFLHVYHHTAMVFFSWLTISGIMTHHVVIPGMINALVHTLMYSYYFLATFQRFQRLLWWKQYVTRLQLGQFVIILLYIFLLYYNGCPLPNTFTFTWMFNLFVFLVLFLNFYYKAYMTKSDDSVKRSTELREKKSS